MIDDNLRYSGTIPDERLRDMHRDLRSPMGGGSGGSGGSGPRGEGIFLVDQVFTRSQDDTYQATKSAFLNPLHKASYGVRIGDIVLFYMNNEGILCTGIVTAISGETVTFVKHDEISTVGFSPSIATTEIPGGHRVTVTNEGGSESFDVMDGVQGPQGEPFEFDDFTQAQLDELRSDVASVYYRKQEATVINFNDASTIGIPFDNFTFADMLFVDIEGLALTENQDYVINGSAIELTTPITHPNTRINFKLLTIMAITSEDLDTLLEGLADFNGATDSADGTHGLVPTPAAGDNLDVLFGNGEWGALDLTTFAWGNDLSISIQANFDNEQAPAALFGSASLPLASATKAGLMKLEDYSKLQGIQAGAQANVIESISVNGNSATVTGKAAAVTIPEATDAASGVMGAGDKAKLDGIAAGAKKVTITETTRGSGAQVVSFSVQNPDGTFEFPPTAVKADSNGYVDMTSVANGSIPNSKLATPYSLPAATTAALGGVKPDGMTVTVDNDGTIHATGSGTIPDGSITGVKIADDTIPDAKLAQTGGVLERVSDLHDTLLDTARVNLALSAFTAGECVNKSGTVTTNAQLQYASVQITEDLVGVELYVSGTAWYDITPYVFVGTSVVYPDTSTGSTLTQITDLSFTPTEVGTLYINKFDYGSTHHVGAAKYDEITSIKPSILPQPLPVKDTIDYDAVALTYTTGKLLNGETGLITDSSQDNYVVTDYTAVLPSTKVMVSTQHFYGQGLYAFYDENRQFISGRSSEAGSTATKMYGEIVNVPTNAAYIVLGLYRQASFFYCYLGQGVKQDALPSQMWSRYKWTCVGDSLTEYNRRTLVHYFDYVSAATGINIVNMGVSGTGYAKGDSYNFMTRIADVPTDSDVVTIFGSGNDGSAGLQLGTASDTGTETLGGVINTTIDNLYAIMPVVNLGIVTPTPWQNNMPSNNGFMENYSNLIVEICKRRSIPCLDLFHCSNLNPNSAEVRALAYSKDNGGGTHPDELGHKLIAPRFKAFLETLLI